MKRIWTSGITLTVMHAFFNCGLRQVWQVPHFSPLPARPRFWRLRVGWPLLPSPPPPPGLPPGGRLMPPLEALGAPSSEEPLEDIVLHSAPWG